jgi:hypothetical protein
MLSKTSQWHTTMPVGGGIHAINKAVSLEKAHDVAGLHLSESQYCQRGATFRVQKAPLDRDAGHCFSLGLTVSNSTTLWQKKDIKVSISTEDN